MSIAVVYEGMSRSDAAAVGGMDRQSLRDWVHRFNEAGPNPEADGVVRWRRVDLRDVIDERFGVVYHERSVSRLLHELGVSHMSARPRHPGQHPAMLEMSKKLPALARRFGSGPAAGDADRAMVAEPAPDPIRG